MTTAASDPHPHANAAMVLAAVGVVFRALALGVFFWPVHHPGLIAQCVIGLALQVTAMLLVRHRKVDHAVLATGLDYGLIANMSPQVGTGAELHLFVLIYPFLSLVITRWSLRTRVLLGVLPPLGFTLLRFNFEPPQDTGLLSVDRLHDLATLNVLVLGALCLTLTFSLLRSRDHATRQMRRLAEARSQLIDDMSHELRTPVAIQLTAAQAALERERSGDEYRRALRVVERQSRSIGRIVDQTLEMGRVERMEDSVDPCDDLAASVREITADHEQLAAARAVQLVVETEEIEASTDAGVLRLLLGNLLANAIRFSPEGGRVEVRVTADGGVPRLDVRDHGPGIPPEDLQQVFTRYWRGDRARSRRDGHIGIGLSIARRAALLLGADVVVESSPGEGATFSVCWR